MHSNHPQEIFVNPQIGGKLRMKAGRKEAFLPCRNDLTVQKRKCPTIATHFFYQRRPYENGIEGGGFGFWGRRGIAAIFPPGVMRFHSIPISYSIYFNFRLERLPLPAKCVAVDFHFRSEEHTSELQSQFHLVC